MKANIPQELVDELNEAYPHRCPDPEDSERQIWMYAGTRQLIDRLTIFAQRQQESILSKK